MQRYPCYICRKDSLEGGSLIHEGMFFKLCPECLNDEEAVRLINEGLISAEEDRIIENTPPIQICSMDEEDE